jgi:chromate reductase
VAIGLARGASGESPGPAPSRGFRRRGTTLTVPLPDIVETRMATFTVGYFVGSLATASINRKLAHALVRLAPKELVMREIPFRDLPLYSYDYDANYPPVASRFKDAIAAVDAVLFVTPEYNRSIPGGLKNAIDWASRPYGKNAFTRKPSAIIGTSPGKIGTAVGQQHLRSILAFCNSPLMNSIEAYIQFEKGLITDDGEVTNESTRKFLEKFMSELHGFIERVYTVLPRPDERQ